MNSAFSFGKHCSQALPTFRFARRSNSEDAGRTALGRIVDKIFHGSAEMALARLVERRPVSITELGRMRRVLDELEREHSAEESEEES